MPPAAPRPAAPAAGAASLLVLLLPLLAAPLRAAAAKSLALRGPPPPVAAARGEGLRVGDEAILCGLSQHAGMNGHGARLLRSNEDSGRWTVRLKGASRAQVDSEHLLLVPPDGLGGAGLPPSCPGAAPLAAAAATTGAAVGAGLQAHVLTASLHNSTTHPVVDNDVFFEGCSEACDDCFATHLQYCVAVCHEGCQVYCKKSTAGIPGCSQKEYWSAMPGGPPQCVWDSSSPNACNKYRYCKSESSDGCPEAYLY